YIVRHCEDKAGKLLQVVRSVPGTGIVYVRSRRRTEEIAALLRSQGISASFYHAGLGPQTRAQRQEDWRSGRTRIMVCTNAFGMGIDKPDVRSVVHYDVPDSPEAYFQEAGRAGRDGKPSFAVLLHGSSDVRRLRQIETLSFPPLDYIEDIYHKVHAFFQIPLDCGEGRQLKFNMEEFCRYWGLSRPSVGYAMKYIERAGHWTILEDTEIQTRVGIIPSRTELNEIDLSEPLMWKVLEVLMRKYVGVFSYPVAIDEEYVASQTDMGVPQLRQTLYRLGVEHVIRYIPKDRSTVLLLSHGRLARKNVDLMPRRYEFLKNAMHGRIEAMIGYVTEDDECRSRYLLRYFGQEKASDCGTCDVCRAGRKL
ncbi:MAG: RecQ family zinc-binding domain-containing protein, partial [Bacteroidales bacterium]|nr:RecQ family zinc-binding domain-containing protein [Bacteroidales bacterium]